MWRTLLRRLDRRDRVRSLADQAQTVSWASVSAASRPSSALLSQIEQTALEVYAAHGLPTRAGHYQRGPRAQDWTFLGDNLPPEARWAEILEHPPEAGWRYSALSDIGRSGPAEVRSAAALLVACALLRERLEGIGPRDIAEDMELAIRLGADWKAFETLRARSRARLKLTAPDGPPSPTKATQTRPPRRPRAVP